MNNEDAYFGTIYVNFEMAHRDKYDSIEKLKRIIDEITGFKPETSWEARTNNIDITIRFNESYDKRETERGDFVYYPFYLEIVVQDQADTDKALNDVCTLILGLRANGANVIPVCDFEEEIETRIGKDRVNWRLNK